MKLLKTESTPTEHALIFLRREKLLPRSDGEHTDQPLVYRVLKMCTESNKYQNVFSIMVFRAITGDGDVMYPFLFPRGITLNKLFPQVTFVAKILK